MFGIFKSNKKEIIQKYLKEGAQLLDVRTASEFNSGHIEGSKNIPFQAIDQKMDVLDKNKPVIVYCAMGGRSNIAASKLKAKGFKVVNAVGIGSMKKHLKSK
jgi:phage shock protein E